MPRLTVTFGKKAARLIDQLPKDRSKAEVIREALALESVGRERQLVRVGED